MVRSSGQTVEVEEAEATVVEVDGNMPEVTRTRSGDESIMASSANGYNVEMGEVVDEAQGKEGVTAGDG